MDLVQGNASSPGFRGLCYPILRVTSAPSLRLFLFPCECIQVYQEAYPRLHFLDAMLFEYIARHCRDNGSLCLRYLYRKHRASSKDFIRSEAFVAIYTHVVRDYGILWEAERWVYDLQTTKGQGGLSIPP